MSSIGLFLAKSKLAWPYPDVVEDSLARAFVLQGSEQVPDGGDANGILIPFRLNYYLAAEDRPRVPGHAVDAAVARWPCLPCFQAHHGEQVLDQGLEFEERQVHEIGTLIKLRQRIAFRDEPPVHHAELKHRTHRQQLGRALRYPRREVLQARQRLDVGQVELVK